LRFTPSEFRNWQQKRITLLGMSGVGKTRLASMLRRHNWFHYSGDFRIGTHYLGEPILDNIKQQAMRVPFLRQLLRSDSIYIANNITADNLDPVSTFLGKLGDPERGGLPLGEFKRRQALHREAEIAALLDVPAFIQKSQEIYGYRHFVNDAGGSVCELEAPRVLEVLAGNTLVLYIRASERDHEELLDRARRFPKPLYYREAFLEARLAEYMKLKDLPYVAMIDPDDFARWVFPHLCAERLPRYDEITRQHGYSVGSDEVARVEDEEGFLGLVEEAIGRSHA
jgi:hypothetical protein